MGSGREERYAKSGFYTMTANDAPVVYLDSSATTPVHPEVTAAMAPYFAQRYANPSSIYPFGQMVKKDIERARQTVAAFINCAPREIIFTATGTEADHFALIRGAELSAAGGRHVVVSGVEHKAILEPARFLEGEGYGVSYLPVDRNGVADVSAAFRLVREDTAIVSLMLVNNEVGSVQPVKEVAGICAKKGVIMHTDAVQAAGKIKLDVDELGVDMLSLSGHKMYAPKGIGVLFIREELQKRLRPFIYGGYQEHGLRGGTENVPYIMGLARAVELLTEEDASYVGTLRDRFERTLSAELEGITINAAAADRVCSISSVTFHGVDAGTLMGYMPEICVSRGSACMSGEKEPSHVLRRMGLSLEEAKSTLRFSFGRLNTADEVDTAVRTVASAVRMLRHL